MTNKRKSIRVPFRHTVRYGQNPPPERLSIVTDLSDGGVCIKTNSIYPPGTRVYLIICVGDRNYEAEGVVAWAKRTPPSLVHLVKSGMGIRFEKVDRELLDVYDKKLKVTAYVEPR